MQVEAQVAGQFKWQIQRADGSIREDSHWVDNLWLDSGLYKFGQYSPNGGIANKIVTVLHLGTGTSVPVATQTTLDTPIRQVSYNDDIARKYDYTVGQPYYIGETLRYIFSPQSTAYNVSELGLSDSSSPTNAMTTRALVKDASGNPTTISVRANETLIVHYQIRLYIDATYTSTFDYDIDVKGTTKTFEVTVRPYINPSASSYFSSGGAFKYLTPSKGISLSDTYHGWRMSGSFPASAVTDEGAQSPYGGVSVDTAYVSGTTSLDIKAVIPRNEGNYTNGIQCVRITTSLGSWVFGFKDKSDNTKGIVKTSFDILELLFKVSWSRYNGAIS